jgi:hypothetical protein
MFSPLEQTAQGGETFEGIEADQNLQEIGETINLENT